MLGVYSCGKANSKAAAETKAVALSDAETKAVALSAAVPEDKAEAYLGLVLWFWF